MDSDIRSIAGLKTDICWPATCRRSGHLRFSCGPRERRKEQTLLPGADLDRQPRPADGKALRKECAGPGSCKETSADGYPADFCGIPSNCGWLLVSGLRTRGRYAALSGCIGPCARNCEIQGLHKSGIEFKCRQAISPLFIGEIRTTLEPWFHVCCTSFMAEPKEKNRAKDIVLWIITIFLVALAIFWYQKPK